MADARELGESLRQYQKDMPSSVQFVLFLILAVLSVALAVFVGQRSPGLGLLCGAAGIVISLLVASESRSPTSGSAAWCCGWVNFAASGGPACSLSCRSSIGSA